MITNSFKHVNKYIIEAVIEQTMIDHWFLYHIQKLIDVSITFSSFPKGEDKDELIYLTQLNFHFPLAQSS